MVKITLNNVSRDSAYKQAIIDIATGTCTVDDGDEIEARLLTSKMDFSHPLLTQPTLHSSNHTYLYQYDDFDGLIDVAKFTYATLIHADNPLKCKFKIRPSKKFLQLKQPYQIPFSIDSKKEASELLSVEQFNSLISRFNGFSFQYQDTVLLEQVITVQDLPPAINGDLLYQTNQDIAEFCKQADNIRKYEIRYINRFIGFGVFAREDIKQGENISCYCGVKTGNKNTFKGYAYKQKDAFNMLIDAMHYGNFARFINHAPYANQTLQIKSSSDVLESNLVNQVHGLYGYNVVIYVAKRDIKKGEQLLANYGKHYFTSDGEYYIRQDGQVIDAANQIIKESRQQRRQALKIMSNYGIKQAQLILIRKPALIFGGALLLTYFLTRSQTLLSI